MRAVDRLVGRGRPRAQNLPVLRSDPHNGTRHALISQARSRDHLPQPVVWGNAGRSAFAQNPWSDPRDIDMTAFMSMRLNRDSDGGEASGIIQREGRSMNLFPPG
jgi:hypothetical protein